MIQPMDTTDFGIDLPISAYDRPTLMMSNLLMRGDLSGAARSLVAPDTLSPSELETFRHKIAGPRPNPVIKTVLDVATNPLVILGLVGGYLVWPAAGGEGLLKLYQGLKAAPPTGVFGKFVGGSFTRLRQYPGMYDALGQYGHDASAWVTRWHKQFSEAYGKIPGVGDGEVVGMRMTAKAKGWDQPRSILQRYWEQWGLRGDIPISPNLQGVMAKNPEQIGAVAKSRKVMNDLGAELYNNKEAMAAIDEAAKERGLTAGQFLENYWPEHIKLNPMQRRIIRYMSEEDIRERTTMGPLSRNLLRKAGEAIPDPDHLRIGEAQGFVRKGFADEMMTAVERRIQVFQAELEPVVQKAMQTSNPYEAMRKGIIGLTSNEGMDVAIADSAASSIEMARASGGNVAQAIADAARMIKTPATYGLDYDSAVTRYLGKMGPTYSWHFAGNGKRMTDLLAKYAHIDAMKPGGPDYNYLMGQVVPLMSGQRSASMVARATSAMDWRRAKVTWLKDSDLAKKLIPEDYRKTLIQRLEDTSFLDSEAAGHAINHYLYLSTMGANIGPAARNVFQNPTTFVNMPGMGWGAWLKGVNETARRAWAYLADALPTSIGGKGIGAEAAFQKHFPDFIEMMGPQANTVAKMFGAENAPGVGLAEKARGIVQKAEQYAMAPFKFSEVWVNRMPAFYGAKARARSWMASSADPAIAKMTEEALEARANRIAANVVDISHFTGGPMGMPAGLLESKNLGWPPFRQFMQFPLRYTDFLAGSTRWGEKAGMDFGTISRAMATSAAVYEVGRDVLGMDFSGGLMAGALPIPQYEKSAFYPWPLVPPIFQIGGNLAMGAMQGKGQPFLDTATLMVPGGMAIRRLQRTLGPKKADYAHRTPDGRIPVYNEDGGLIGAYTPFQLSLRAIGIQPQVGTAERAAAQWLTTQRDRLRQYRRSWLDAQMANDQVLADKIQGQFRSEYPELNEMQISKSDLKSIQQRRETARISRILRGFPAAYRPLFQNVVMEGQLAPFTQNLQPQQPLSLAG